MLLYIVQYGTMVFERSNQERVKERVSWSVAHWSPSEISHQTTQETKTSLADNFVLESFDQEINMWDSDFVRECLWKSVNYKLPTFAEKYQEMVENIANQSLSAHDILKIIKEYERNIDYTAKWTLNPLKFIGHLTKDKDLQIRTDTPIGFSSLSN